MTTPIKNIIIQSPKKFEYTVKNFKCREVSPFPDYRIKNSVISSEPKFTTGANTCSILGMSNGKDTFLGHFAPELNENNFLGKLDDLIKRFKDETGQLSAILTGGHDYNFVSAIYQSKNSYTRLAEIGGLLDKNKVNNLTVIAGKKEPTLADSLAVTNDAFILSHLPKSITDKLEFPKNPTRPEIENTYSKKYSIVELDEGHNINYFE